MHTSLPGTDAEGFISQTPLGAAAQNLALAQFVEAYPVPGLLVSPAETLGEASQESQARHLLTVSFGSAKALRYVNRVAFLAKRPGNPFPKMISLGRATNSDLVVAVDSVSKFHGCFETGGEDWFYIDQSSTNGTMVNGVKLEPRHRTLLKDGDLLQFGLEVQARFLLPQSLYDQLRKGA